jgi:3-oxoacyl-[acyl-carrier protein] reductase
MIFAREALSGRKALVTGGTRGIGRGIVFALAHAGAEVIFCGRDAATGESMEAEFASKGLAVQFLAADVENEAGIDALAAEAGPIDILVNNVGGAYDAAAGLRPFDAIPPGDWPKTYMKCVFNAVRLIDAVLPHMRERGWGRIINISSVAGLEPGYSPADYASAKAALNSLTLALSTSLARTGVTANIVSPGPILTDALQPVIDSTAESRGWPETAEAREQRFLAEVMPLKVNRIGRPEDIGAAVAFFATQAADYITGANLRVDGGQSASI